MQEVIIVGLAAIIVLLLFAVSILQYEVRHANELKQVWFRQALDYANELDRLKNTEVDE